MSPFELARRTQGRVTKTQVRAAIRKVRAKYDSHDTSAVTCVRTAIRKDWL